MANYASLVVPTALAALLSYKAVAVVKHVGFIARKGNQLRIALDRRRAICQFYGVPASNQDVINLLRPIGGDRLTSFGFKEYRVRAWIDRNGGAPAWTRRSAAMIGKILVQVYDFVVLGSLAGIVLVWSGFTARDSSLSVPISIAGLVVAVLLAFISMVIAIDASVNYFSLSAYGLAHQNPRAYISGSPLSGPLIEALTIIGTAGSCVYVDTTIISFLATAGIADFGEADLAGGPGGIFNSFYTAFMTFIFSTPLSPDSIVGRVVVIFVSIHGLAVLILAVTAFGSSKA